jgi:putative hydrolase of the HAD superfamily
VAPTAPQLDALLFDVDDTLYSTTAFSLVARRRSIQAMIAAGLRVSEEDGFAELMEVVTEFSSNYSNHFERLLDRLGPESYAGRNPAMVVAAGVVAYHGTKQEGMRLLADVAETLERLHAAGIRMGVLSAGLHVKQAEKLVRLGAAHYFDPEAIFFTDQLGISKPNPKLFTKACEAMNLDPRRGLYIGDRLEHDVLPASSIGLRTVLYGGAHGKYSRSDHTTPADHVLMDLRNLLPILRDTYHLPL